MVNKFQYVSFSSCDLKNEFFDSLRADYDGFNSWFSKKASSGANTYVFSDNTSINAFLYIKEEDEELLIKEHSLPRVPRVKIGTLKLSNDIQGQRLGEGAIGLALWHWQKSKCNQIYVTVFEKHQRLINLLQKFGFYFEGHSAIGENVYIKDRLNLDYSTPYTCFPFIHSGFQCAGYIPVEHQFHDILFRYSELSRTSQEASEEAAANGITKVFIATPSSRLDYFTGKPVLIYRISDEYPKKYHSVVSSYCTITRQTYIKVAGTPQYTFEQFKDMAGNKTVFDETRLCTAYSKYNVVLLEMVYNGYFGKGHNVTYNDLKEAGYFDSYPYNVNLTPDEFKDILSMGDIDVPNVVID